MYNGVILLIISEGVVQYEAVIEQKDLMQDTEMLLEQVNIYITIIAIFVDYH